MTVRQQGRIARRRAAASTSPVRQRVKAATTTQATTLTATLPGTVQTGNLLVALITATAGSAGITMPAGWTQRAVNTNGAPNSFVYDHTTTSTSDNAVTLTLPSGGAVIYLLELAGTTGFGVSAVTDGPGPSASYTAGPLTPTTAKSLLLAFTAYATNTAMTFGAPVTEVDEHQLAGATSALFHNGYAEASITATTAQSVTITPATSASGWETILLTYKLS